jgi:hypothetical protein
MRAGEEKGGEREGEEEGNTTLCGPFLENINGTLLIHYAFPHP